jgi:GAF domain-containing protein
MVFGGKVIGVLNCAKTTKGAHFTPGDLEFLSILSGQAAVAIENARLFRTIQRQKLQIEKLLQRVIQPQENERKRVAADIHDDVAQQMVAAL